MEESLLWIYKSHQPVSQQVPTILAVLERRLGRIQIADRISHSNAAILSRSEGFRSAYLLQSAPGQILREVHPRRQVEALRIAQNDSEGLRMTVSKRSSAAVEDPPQTAGAAPSQIPGEKSGPAPELAAEESFHTLLDRMISITRGLFPAVSDLAREVRYRCFDQPLFEQARKQIYAKVEDHLAYLAADPQAADRDERIRELVDCPQPLVGLLCGRFAAADRGLRGLMLEVMTRRYYRVRSS